MLIKFVLSSGEHFYDKAKDDLLDKVKESNSRHTFLIKDNKRFEYVGINKDEIPTFKEVKIVDIKAACTDLAIKLASVNMKLAAELLNSPIVANKEQIERFIKQIGIPNDSTKIQQIKELKNKGSLYGRDEAKIKVLWWEAKRDALTNQMRELNLTMPLKQESSFLIKVLEELNKRIAESVRKYQDFPEAKANLDIQKIFRTAMIVRTWPDVENDRRDEFRRLAKAPQGFGKALDDIFSVWSDFGAMEENKNFDLPKIKELYKKMKPSLEVEEYYHKQIHQQTKRVKELIDTAEYMLDLVKTNDAKNLENETSRVSKIDLGLYPELLDFIDNKVTEHLKSIKGTNEFALWLLGRDKYRKMAEQLK